MENLSGVRLRVSRTCCKLANRHEPQSHVNPRPLNETLCQSQYEDEYLKFRNQEVRSWSSTVESNGFVGMPEASGTFHSNRKRNVCSARLWISSTVSKFQHFTILVWLNWKNISVAWNHYQHLLLSFSSACPSKQDLNKFIKFLIFKYFTKVHKVHDTHTHCHAIESS